MGAEESRLTLQALAQRLETLERENAELRSKVASLESSGTRRHADAERASESSEADLEGRMCRRRMLGRAGALFVCVKRGNPGKWRKVTTTTA